MIKILLLASSLLISDAESIRWARLDQNKAMASGDVERTASYWTEDVTLRRGLGGASTGKEAYKELFIASDIQYIREPETIEVSPDWPLAFESGIWRGEKANKPLIQGRYSAQWVKREDKWYIRSEVFVALHRLEGTYDHLP